MVFNAILGGYGSAWLTEGLQNTPLIQRKSQEIFGFEKMTLQVWSDGPRRGKAFSLNLKQNFQPIEPN